MSIQATETIEEKGKLKTVPSIQSGGNILIVQGTFLKVARLKNEWYNEFLNPERTIGEVRALQNRPDLLTFWQRLPDTEPRFPYYFEREKVAAVRIRNFDDWWNNMLASDTRKKARRAEKRGVTIKMIDLSDDFVDGVIDIYNETPVKRGKPFWHYGKHFDAVKEQLSRDLSKSEFIAAYCDGLLIGFVKLVYADKRFANPALIFSRIEYQHKYTTSALIAKSVERCAENGVPYLTYAMWRRGSHAAFLARHGFTPIEVPRYWLSLSWKGSLALRMGVNRKPQALIPNRLRNLLLRARARYYSTRVHR